MLGGVRKIERVEDERLSERERGDAFDDRLVHDGIVRADLRGFLADARLLDLAEEFQAASVGLDGGIEVHADIEIGVLGFAAALVFGIPAGDDGDLAALLQGDTLAGGDDERLVACANFIGAIEIRDGEGQPI